MVLSECRHVGEGSWEIPQMDLGCVFLGDPSGAAEEGVLEETLRTARERRNTLVRYGSMVRQHKK